MGWFLDVCSEGVEWVVWGSSSSEFELQTQVSLQLLLVGFLRPSMFRCFGFAGLRIVNEALVLLELQLKPLRPATNARRSRTRAFRPSSTATVSSKVCRRCPWHRHESISSRTCRRSKGSPQISASNEALLSSDLQLAHFSPSCTEYFLTVLASTQTAFYCGPLPCPSEIGNKAKQQPTRQHRCCQTK